MANTYRPKIKVQTAKSMAQRMATTQQGKQVTAGAFKKFLRSEKELRGITYKQGSTHITQHQAQKFLKTAAEKIQHAEKYKLSQYAKRTLGVRPSSKDTVGMTGIKHAYQVGAQQEAASEAPKGPSAEEVMRQKRIETARKIMHQRDRAEDIRKEYKIGDKKETAGGTASARPPQISGGAASVRQSAPATSAASPMQMPSRVLRSRALKSRIRTAVMPVRNMSQMRELTLLAEKLEETVRRALTGLPSIELIPRVMTVHTLQSLGWQDGRVVSFEFSKRVAKSLNAEYVFFGTITHETVQAHVEIFLQMVSSNSVLKLADVREHYVKTFEIEKRVSWQVKNFFEDHGPAGSSDTDVEIPSAAEAIDIPI